MYIGIYLIDSNAMIYLYIMKEADEELISEVVNFIIYFNLNKNATELFGESKIIRNNKNTSIINNFEITDFDLDKHIIFNKANSSKLIANSLIKKIMWLNNINTVFSI